MSSDIKEILYPFFLKCIEFTNNDKYWNNIFENLSYGICPYNTYIYNQYLCCNHKIHKFKYYFIDREPEELYTDIYKLLSNMGIMSNKDKLSIYNINKEHKYNNWIDIKKKSIKQTLIEKFVIEKMKKHNLDYDIAYKLLNNIILGLLLKTIVTKHIKYENNKIIDITCLQFSNNSYSFSHNINNYNSNFIVI